MRLGSRDDTHKHTLLPRASEDHAFRAVAGSSNLLRRGREADASVLVEDHRPVLIGHGLVHERTVAVTLHVGSQTLVRLAPGDLADLVTGERPAFVAVEAGPNSSCIFGPTDIQEGVA